MHRDPHATSAKLAVRNCNTGAIINIVSCNTVTVCTSVSNIHTKVCEGRSRAPQQRRKAHVG
eukprot:6173869-Pleurochrysis_carterae.AAC.4